MIDPDTIQPIRFQKDDIPEMSDIPLPDPLEEAQQKDADARRLEQEMGFRPFDVEW